MTNEDLERELLALRDRVRPSKGAAADGPKFEAACHLLAMTAELYRSIPREVVTYTSPNRAPRKLRVPVGEASAEALVRWAECREWASWCGLREN